MSTPNPNVFAAKVLALVILQVILLVLAFNGGRTYEKGKQSDALVATIQQGAKDNRASSDVGAETAAEAATAQVANEGVTNATHETIRYVYRDNPVGANCFQPAGVVQAIRDQAERTNSAVRAGAAASPASVP